MQRIALAAMFSLAVSLGFVGCAEKTQVQKTEKVETPGGTTETTTTVEQSKTGDHAKP